MNRLTKRQAFTVGGVIYAKCEHCQDKRPECFGEQCPVPDEALISLAAYEDTGLEPEEIKQMCALARLNSNIFDNDFGNHIAELIVAERDGRLVVLPCKVGDTLYVDKRTIVDGWRVKGVSAELATGKVVAFSTNKQSAFIKIEFFYNQGEKTFRDRYVISAIGKTVFLTRAEAEAALKDAHKQGGEQDA